jgi:hypothetical protein
MAARSDADGGSGKDAGALHAFSAGLLRYGAGNGCIDPLPSKHGLWRDTACGTTISPPACMSARARRLAGPRNHSRRIPLAAPRAALAAAAPDPTAALQALAAAGRPVSSFPPDFAAAVEAGRVDAALVRRYLSLESELLTGGLMGWAGACCARCDR